jgi:hypothetical protein
MDVWIYMTVDLFSRLEEYFDLQGQGGMGGGKKNGAMTLYIPKVTTFPRVP